MHYVHTDTNSVWRRQSKLSNMSLRLLSQTKNLPSTNEYKWVSTWVRGWDHSWGGIWRTALWWATGLVRKGKIFNVEECQYGNGCRAARYVQNITCFFPWILWNEAPRTKCMQSCLFTVQARNSVLYKLYSSLSNLVWYWVIKCYFH